MSLTRSEAEAVQDVLHALTHPRAELSESRRRQLVRSAATLASSAERALPGGMSARDVREAMTGG